MIITNAWFISCDTETSKIGFSLKTVPIIYSLKINELNRSSQAGIYFFDSTPAKNTMFELNNCFAFHQT